MRSNRRHETDVWSNDRSINPRRRELLQTFDEHYPDHHPFQERENTPPAPGNSPETNVWGGLTGRRYGDDQGSSSHYGKGPKGWKRSDKEIREDICEALYENGLVDASDIDVHVTDGFVYLRGTVESLPMKRVAEDSLERIRGVEDIQNELRVRKRENELS